jgi:glycerol-3-phosphate dehydrogenase
MTLEFSHRTRREFLSALDAKPLDLLVVGGGVTGAFTAWDAAARGLRVALVERGDFGSGTSSRSARLAHGGLRYLESFQFGLVFEGTHERRSLIDIAPHLVRPLPFLVPTYRGDKNGRFLINIGLWLYDMLAGTKGLGWHRSYKAAALKDMVPSLRADGLTGGLRYFDCATDDARLTLSAIRTAREAGAMPMSRVHFRRPILEDGVVVGAELEDLIGGESLRCATKCIVNAVGPWTDAVLETWPGKLPMMLRPSKGIHLVLPRERLPVNDAVVMNAPQDGRVTFCIPWRECTYVGTTDTELVSDPSGADGSARAGAGAPWASGEIAAQVEGVRADAADVAYLLEILAHYFPEQRIQADDVIATWAGVRPLVGQDKDSSYDVSREHTIITHPGGGFTIAGGKLTTCRKMGEELVDHAIGYLRSEGDKRPFLSCKTKESPLVGGEGLSEASLESHRLELESRFGVSTYAAEHFQTAFGAHAAEVLARAEETDRLEPILEGYPYIWGEIDEAVRNEMTLSLADFMIRRTHLFYKAGDQGASVEERVAERLGELLDWDEDTRQRELAWYRSLRKDSVAFRETETPGTSSATSTSS